MEQCCRKKKSRDKSLDTRRNFSPLKVRNKVNVAAVQKEKTDIAEETGKGHSRQSSGPH